MNLYLVGMMGAGKSTVGRLLAERLTWPFLDLDQLIEAEAGMAVPALFASVGEAAFREREESLLARIAGGWRPDGLAAGQPVVVATGGGAVLREVNRERMRVTGLVIWLEADPGRLVERTVADGVEKRPLLAGADPADRLTELLARRAPLYGQAAHRQIATDGRSVEAVADEILSILAHHGRPTALPVTEVPVETPGGSYLIRVGSGLLATLGEAVQRVLPKVTKLLVLTDANVGALHGAAAVEALRSAGLDASLLTIPAGESSKSLDQLGRVWEACAEAGLDRSSGIIALGGGVVGDLAGFVAATYMRGIPFVQVPTTLLACVDSSVGGKTGIDLPQGKNLVGSFHQPVLVLIDVDLLRTLPGRELSAGLAEVVKHGIIQDAALLDWLEREAEAVLACAPDRLAELVAWNCRIKAAVVGQDERESGLRAILNFGHTIGHALEAVVGRQADGGAVVAVGAEAVINPQGEAAGHWVHGECVAVGTVGALFLSQALGLLEEAALLPRIEALLQRLDLPTRFPAHVPAKAVLPYIARDKKATKGRPKWVLAQRAGSVLLSTDVTDEAVMAALAYLTAQQKKEAQD